MDQLICFLKIKIVIFNSPCTICVKIQDFSTKKSNSHYYKMIVFDEAKQSSTFPIPMSQLVDYLVGMDMPSGNGMD